LNNTGIYERVSDCCLTPVGIFQLCHGKNKLHFDEMIVFVLYYGNQKPYIEEEQTTQWPKEKVQKDKQRSTKHTYKTKDRVTRTPLKTGENSCAPEE
jgi:hypothetical protein